MANKFLFTGEEHYLLHQELRTRTNAFLEKYGEQGLFIFKSNELDQSVIANSIFGGTMFATKKLIVIYGIPKDNTTSNKTNANKSNAIEEYLQKQWGNIPDNSIIIFVSYKPDKRTKGYKFLSKHTDIKEYKPLQDKQLEGFVQHKLGKLITPGQAGLIINLVGTNMFNIANECEKLQLYAEYNTLEKLTNENIQDIVYSQTDIDSFKILDNIFTNKSKALTLITQAQQQNKDLFQFLGMLYRGLKLVIQMVDLDRQGIKNSKEIASILKIHPFAVSKQHKHIAQLRENYEKITHLFHQLLQLDWSIKSGQYPSEGFWIEIKKLVYKL